MPLTCGCNGSSRSRVSCASLATRRQIRGGRMAARQLTPRIGSRPGHQTRRSPDVGATDGAGTPTNGRSRPARAVRLTRALPGHSGIRRKTRLGFTASCASATGPSARCAHVRTRCRFHGTRAEVPWEDGSRLFPSSRLLAACQSSGQRRRLSRGVHRVRAHTHNVQLREAAVRPHPCRTRVLHSHSVLLSLASAKRVRPLRYAQSICAHTCPVTLSTGVRMSS